MDSRPQTLSRLAFTSRRCRSLVAAGLASASLVMSAGQARAQSCKPSNGLSTCVDADNLWPTAGTGPFLSVAPALTMPAGRASFGIVLSYLSRPVGLAVASPSQAGTTINAIDDAVNATFLGSLGISDRFELTLAAPITLYQSGAGLGGVTGTKDELVRSAVRDLRFGGAFALIKRSRVGALTGPALTLRLDFAAPTATPGVFAGGATMTAAPSLTYDQRLGRLGLGMQAGARIRGESKLANAVVGTQIYYSLGASFDVIPGGLLSIGGEGFALLTLAQQGPRKLGVDPGTSQPLVPAEWIASATSAPFLAGDLGFTLAGGGPIPLSNEALTAPRFRFDVALRYAPTGHDLDGDSILDRDDKCPSNAEDRDGFQDEDGCPDPDNDGDGILDAKDKCRDAAEDFDGSRDDDGCPDDDDDGDGVPDTEDRCRSEAEDRDGFQDEDGCPDPDNDGDGILDKADRCPTEAETIDGNQDADGCPEAGAKSQVSWAADRVVVEKPARFGAGSAKLGADLEKQAKMSAQLVLARSPLDSVIIEAFPDRAGDTSLAAVDLAARRADALKSVFIAAGLGADKIVAAAGDLALERAADAPQIEITARRAAPGRKRRASPTETEKKP